MLRNNAYKAFGLTIKSEIMFAELQQVDMDENSPDLSISITDLTSLWNEQAIPKKHFVVQQDFVLFHVPSVAIFLIRNGNEILVSPIRDSNEDQIRLYILGTCMGALLMQRKKLPLHGSAIAIDGKAYAIVGDSGAGKSTLASVFLKKGYSLLSDDVIPIILDENNIPMVIPAYPQQKLWVESLNQFGMDSELLRPIIDRETKFAVPVAEQFANKPLPLAGIFELTKTDSNEIGIQTINNLKRLRTFYTHTYRNFLINRLGLLEWHFGISATIVNRIDFYNLKRPASYFTGYELVDLALSKIKKGEKVT